MPAALAAFGHGQHLVVDKFHQAPGAGDGQQHFHATGGDLLGVQTVGLHDGVNVVQCADLVDVLVNVQEHRRVDVGLPGEEPVG